MNRTFTALWVLVCVTISFSVTAVGVIAPDAVQVTLTETGRITSYFDEYWVVNVDGTASVSNPTDRDLYEVQIRYDLGSLTIVDVDGTSYISATSLNIPRIPANSTVDVPYNVVGISLVDPALIDKGVMYTAITKLTPVIYSDTFGQLQKASLENENLTGRPGRLISVELRNPTGFQFTINSLKVIKTPSIDPNQILDEWNLINDTDPLTISPDALFVRDILDYNSGEGLVYWLVADVFISRVEFIDNSSVARYTQVNLTLPPELLNYTFNETNESERILREESGIYARKLADRQIVTAGTPVKLSLILNNFETELIKYTVTDKLPPGFTFVSGDDWTARGEELTYSGSLSARSAAVISYTAELTDTTSAGLDFFDAAKIDYNGKTSYSDRVRFIRQYLPSEKIYVQKKLRYEGEEDVLVTISVQNLGSTRFENLLLKDYLEDADVFSQITEVPDEKGLWRILTLAPGESWEVSYYTTKETQLNILPNLYGVANGEVLRSLVLDNIVLSAWERVRTSAAEIMGVLLLISLPILYIVWKRRIHSP